MVYLDCPHCKETTEHQILALTNTKVTVRCTECMLEWEGTIIMKEDSFYSTLERKKGKDET